MCFSTLLNTFRISWNKNKLHLRLDSLEVMRNQPVVMRRLGQCISSSDQGASPEVLQLELLSPRYFERNLNRIARFKMIITSLIMIDKSQFARIRFLPTKKNVTSTSRIRVAVRRIAEGKHANPDQRLWRRKECTTLIGAPGRLRM